MIQELSDFDTVDGGGRQDPVLADDRIWVVIYCEVLDRWEFKMDGANERGAVFFSGNQSHGMALNTSVCRKC